MTITHPKTAHTPHEMRAAIADLFKEVPMVNACMKIADIEHMTSEDRYTILAYHALCSLARTQESYLEHVKTCMRPLNGYEPVLLKVNIEQMAKAFDAWENGYRANPQQFMTPEQVAAAEVSQLSADRAAYFHELLTTAVGSQQTS